MSNFFFTSEAVGVGHPDKIADQLSDCILDAAIEQDPDSRVACEALVTQGLVVLAGEISSNAYLDYQDLTRNMIKEIGYDDGSIGFDYRSCGVLLSITKQSPDIAMGVDSSDSKEQGAGDQGIMFGYACDDTKELMPLPLMLAYELVGELRTLRESGDLSYLRPDCKSQVTVEYAADYTPQRIDAIVVSTQHAPEISHEQVVQDIKAMALRVMPENMIDDKTTFHINPTGRFVKGGPAADCGITGRKIIVDTYGGMGRHGGGAFSGKDPSKVDRSAAYAARYVAKNIVASGLARRCEVQFSYAIGVPEPVSIKVSTFGTSKVPEDLIANAVPEVFSLTPKGMIEMLELKRPIYRKTAWGGHFGRDDQDFTWEATDRCEPLLKAVGKAEPCEKLST